MYTISPARIGAGFALAAAIALPFAVTLVSQEKPSTAEMAVIFATTAPSLPTYREDRLLPSTEIISDDDSNGCGMMRGVDVCALDFVQNNMPQYIR